MSRLSGTARRPTFTVVDDLDVALAVADRASDVALEHFTRGVTGRTKPDGTLVTTADLDVDAVARTLLGRLRPRDGVLSEERASSPGHGARRWIVDPIDGTHWFASGDPHWRVHLALEDDWGVAVAVVAWPALRFRWWSARGQGGHETRWHRGRLRQASLRVTGETTLTAAGVSAFPRPALGRVPARYLTARESIYPLVDLLRGRLGGYVVLTGAIWDHAPYTLLVEEAGGRWSDLTGGRELTSPGAVFSNRTLHDEVLGLVADVHI